MTADIVFEWYHLFYFGILLVLSAGIRLIMATVRKRTVSELNRLLHQEGNFILYQELLDNPRLRLSFRKQTLMILKLRGYLLSGDECKIKELIAYLDRSRLTVYEKTDYYQKRFSYFAQKQDAKETEISLNYLKSLEKKDRRKTIRGVISEAELIYEIYIRHNPKIIPRLLEAETNYQNNIQKGITEYRLAKLYYFDNQPEKARAYLEKAKINTEGTYWHPVILEALKNNQVLAVK
jgi:tetratricopeptide (TPR) repeat protein